MWSKFLKMEVTESRLLRDFDLNLLVAELEGYKQNDEGDAYEEIEDRREDLGYVETPVYFAGNYDKLYRLITRNKIGIVWLDDGTVRTRMQIDKYGVVTTRHKDLERSVLETYLTCKIHQQENDNARS